MAKKTRKTLNKSSEPFDAVPTSTDQTDAFEAFFQRLDRIGNNHRNNNQNDTDDGAPYRRIGNELLERFHVLQPDKFDGLVKACEAEQWLQGMDRILEAIECSETEKRRLAIF